MKTAILFILTICSIINIAYAQPELSTSKLKTDQFLVGYQVGLPSNGDFLSETSWRGGTLDYRRMIKPNLSVGISASWNSFEEYIPPTTYQKPDGTGAVTSDLIRTFYTVPITATVHYYKPATGVTPYVGLGLGTQYSDERHFANIYQFSAESWGFVVKPEVGLIKQFNSDIGAFLNVSYNYNTVGSEIFNDQDSWQHFAFTLGLAF
ncbi:outer membrane beta-barrel protein [Flavihumibacter sp. R14]|nr:outer membrane beta-barrel protein [Flavihumibacter soli]